MTVLWKRRNAIKYSNHRKLSFLTDTAKIVARLLRRKKERNLRLHVEKMGLYIEEQKDADSDITTNCGYS
jgi:RNA polymerase-interacting CarD/CdnL/TRCF family regulator